MHTTASFVKKRQKTLAICFSSWYIHSQIRRQEARLWSLSMLHSFILTTITFLTIKVIAICAAKI